MKRIYNFAAGPATMPISVLKKAADELLQHGVSGQSVMEMSHRSPEFEEIHAESQQLLRDVMQIPDNYKILFIQGGASLQFSMIPTNLLSESGSADYVVSGMFSKKAYDEALPFGKINLVASSESDGFTKVPVLDSKLFNPKADYFHLCQNNTIYGTRFKNLPDTGEVPIVADLSSNILSEPFDVDNYGMIYAGAQKNMGIAGLCVVIIRNDLFDKAPSDIPTMLKYKTYADNNSLYNTPPTYSIYMMGLMLKWILSEFGNLASMQAHNQEKAYLLYDYLDQSKLFHGIAEKESRSIMNVTFTTGDANRNKSFCQKAREDGFYNLNGHRAAGGMRASIYNAMPVDSIQALVEYMAGYEKLI